MPEPLKVMRQIWVSAKSVDGPSWTVETGGEFSSDDNNRNDRLEFLRDDGPEGYCSEFLRDDGPEGYCSFILQKSVDAIKETTQKVPVTTLPLASAAESGPSDGDTMETSSPIWVFVGRNKKNASIQGRPEHTDSISHSGTFHYQISGSKIWRLRPTDELWKNSENDLNEDTIFEIECREGDVIVLNTRLWWHSTSLPSTSNARGGCSISIARDLHFNKDLSDELTADGLTNVDGIYAPRDIEEGTVVFRESDMPDAELHRVKHGDHNCEVVELEEEEEEEGEGEGEGEDGEETTMMAVVSTRQIKAGEFYTLPESSDDENWKEFDEDDEDDDDGGF